MNAIVHCENAAKLKSGTMKLLIISGACTLIGAVILALPHGYIEAALGGGLLGGGACGVWMCIQALGRAKKGERVLVRADENGLTVALTPAITSTIEWGNVRGVEIMKKGVNNVLLVHLNDEAAFTAALTPKEAKQLKANQTAYKTLVAVGVNYCVAPPEQILADVNSMMPQGAGALA